MHRIRIIVVLVVLFLAGLATTGYVSAGSSTGFYEKSDGVYDDWGVCRTTPHGENGYYQVSETSFRPIIAFESLGEEIAEAYALGGEIAQKYPDEFQRAEAIFYFVRDRVDYTTDEDQFNYKEFAQNADEVALAIQKSGTGYGDCEDSAVLLAVMYRGAGYRSAIVVGKSHTACLVYLPGYDKASVVFELDGEPGWVWAEATGRNNPFGWTSKEFIDVNLASYEIADEVLRPAGIPKAPAKAVAKSGGTSSGQPFPFFSVVILLWLISWFSSLFRRRSAG